MVKVFVYKTPSQFPFLLLKAYNPCCTALHLPGWSREHIDCLFSQMSNWRIERGRNLEEEGLSDRLNCWGFLMLEYNCLYFQLKIELAGLFLHTGWGRGKWLVVQHFINIYILFVGSCYIRKKVSTWNSISSTKKSKNS